MASQLILDLPCEGKEVSGMAEEDLNNIPRLNQCYLCKIWTLETNLSPVEVPDQGSGYIKKLACEKCLGAILATPERAK